MEQFSDTYLIRQVQKGDLETAAILYERYKKPLWSFFFNCTQERSLSEDLVQLTFEKMIRYRLNYSGKGSFKSWLFSIARNVLKDAWSQQGRLTHQRSLKGSDEYIQDGSPSVEDHLISQDRQGILQAAIDQLPPDKKELLILIKIEGKKYKEVAQIYQMSESALKVRLFRVMKELKAKMERIQARHHY